MSRMGGIDLHPGRRVLGWSGAGRHCSEEQWGSNFARRGKRRSVILLLVGLAFTLTQGAAITMGSTSPPGSCRYFNEDFTGSYIWTHNGVANWTFSNGKLYVYQISSDLEAKAYSDFAPDDFFYVDVDVEVVALAEKGYYGIEASTTRYVLPLIDGDATDTIGATVHGDGTVQIVWWDFAEGEWKYSTSYIPSEPVTSLGVEFTSDGITLRINRAKTSLKVSGTLTSITAMNRILLFANGGKTNLFFDNVCANPIRSALRELSGCYNPSAAASVSITLTPDTGTLSYAVEDAPPEGWTVADINESGVWDSVNKKVRWGPFLDSNGRTLTYQATPPAGQAGTKTFSGTVTYDGTYVAIAGDSILGGCPDLTGRWTVPPGCDSRGKCKGTLSVSNFGAGDALPSTVSFYLSADQTLDAGDSPLGQVAIKALKAGASKAAKFKYTAPSGVTTSGKFVFAVIDEGNTLEEASEANNVIPSSAIP